MSIVKMAYDHLVASITLTGSLLSAIATGCVLITFVVYRHNQKSFRHALVFNLALADFINAVDLGISGSFYVHEHVLYPGPACTFNGWLCQVSVQATDFSILAISLATLLVVTKKSRLMTMSATKKTLICLSVWIWPLITSTTITALGEMEPVSGNWCWISQGRTDLRYGLAHGWRFAIMLITLAIYSYIWWYISRHFKSLGGIRPTPPVWKRVKHKERTPVLGAETHPVLSSFYDQLSSHRKVSHFESRSQGSESELLEYPTVCRPYVQRIEDADTTTHAAHCPESSVPSSISPTGLSHPQQQAERNIKKMLLLNGYPIMYVILWIPGLVNRVMEASGNTSNTRVLAILQCSTQFVGFANAVTYGLNQSWRPGR
ncbi:hypothetical protein F4778DRAFT_573550 [Xylariomycetidae sp. FL2044]|nr:hypothetical protein F4778DRAFT_573550 [Xylariomycetidae sp. FL2044]